MEKQTNQITPTHPPLACHVHGTHVPPEVHVAAESLKLNSIYFNHIIELSFDQETGSESTKLQEMRQ